MPGGAGPHLRGVDGDDPAVEVVDLPVRGLGDAGEVGIDHVGHGGEVAVGVEAEPHVGHGEGEDATLDQDALDLGQPPEQVGHVLDDVRGDDHVDRAVGGEQVGQRGVSRTTRGRPRR